MYKYLCEEKKEFVISKQLLRCGTSVGANVEEAVGGQSKKDFINKFSIAYKEARECHYWVRLIRDSGYVEGNLAKSLLDDCDELIRLTGKIISSSKKSSNF